MVFQDVVCIYDTFMKRMFVVYILVFEFSLYWGVRVFSV